MQHFRARTLAYRGPALRLGFMVVLVFGLAATAALAQRTQIRPGFNLLSPAQDVEMGREVAKDAERQLPMLNDRRVDEYLNRLGQKLAGKAPGEKYPYQFKAVNDVAINAFALPGGFLYINRGTIEAADNEAQLAGVMGHEIGHVALRHGTNQASKATLFQLGLAGLGGAVGGDSVAGMLAQIGAGFAAQSVLLKYSRDAERQSDIIGTQILYDNGYNPKEMANFFQKLAEENGGKHGIQFFSSHPNPENRVTNVSAEVRKMGGELGRYRNDSTEFQQIQRYVRSLPAAPKAATPGTSPSDSGRASGGARPQPPSTRYQAYQNSSLSMNYPDNWRSAGDENGFALAPEGGFVSDGSGGSALAYGMMMGVFQPKPDRSGRVDVETATDQLLQDMQRANPQMRATRQRSSVRLAGRPALSSTLSNPSPVGGNEIDWLVTTLRPEGLVYFVFVAPEGEFSQYQRAFQDMLGSVRFLQR